MKLLHWFFNIIYPKGGNNWLSIQFSRWNTNRMKNENSNYLKYSQKESVYFDVPGAGKIEMSKSCHQRTGRVMGFGFGVEWGRYGFCGGVIGRTEAKKMANFILETCSEVIETEEEEIKRTKEERIK